MHELQTRLERGDVIVVDVRTAEELALAAMPGALHIPLHELPARVGELNPDAVIAVLCHHGVRSLTAARYLEQSGFSDVSSVAGGIDAWSVQIDPAVTRY